MKDKATFRKDLYYRLRGAWLHLPPLRERKEDIPLLVDKFLNDFSETAGDHRIEEDAIALLMNYDYPGNIRELKSILRTALNLSQGNPITINSLPTYLPRRKNCFMKECRNRPDQIEPRKINIFGPYRSVRKPTAGDAMPLSRLRNEVANEVAA